MASRSERIQHMTPAQETELQRFHQRWLEAVRALLAVRTPIAQAVTCILGRPAGIKNIISLQR